jgi:UDPglucose 6-dehydrogenase
MNIGIIGYGIVGKAQEHVSKVMGHKTYVSDIDSSLPDNLDIAFICTPETVVDNVILKYKDKVKLLVLKSTVPVGTTNKLMKDYNIHICHNPEFLREKTSLEDVINPPMILIGYCCEKHLNILKEYYSYHNNIIYTATTVITETVKLTMNNYLSTLITFWNEINKLCDYYNIDVKKVASLCINDKRVSTYGFEEPRVISGKCLPKDLRQMLNIYKDTNIPQELFNAVGKINNVNL